MEGEGQSVYRGREYVSIYMSLFKSSFHFEKGRIALIS